MLHVLSSALVLHSPISLTTVLPPAESPSCAFPESPSLSFPIFISCFTFSPHISFLPFLFHPPPSLTTLSSLHNPLTSLINVSTHTHTPCSSPPLIRHSPFTCFSQLPFHFPLLIRSHTITHLFIFCLGASVSFPSCHLPGGLAVEHHHHGQLHEQVQPSVLVPASAQTHGVEPPRGLVPPQENR